MRLEILFTAFGAATLLAASPASAQGVSIVNSSLWDGLHEWLSVDKLGLLALPLEKVRFDGLHEWLSVDKLAVLLIFGTGLFAVVFTGTIKLIGALRGNSALSDEMLGRIGYLEERLAAVEQALAANPGAQPVTMIYTQQAETCPDAGHRVS